MRAVRGPARRPLIEVRHTRVAREISRTEREHAALIRDLELADEKGAGLHRGARVGEHQRDSTVVELMSLYSASPGPSGLAREQNPLVRVALAVAEHGQRRHEHGGV